MSIYHLDSNVRLYEMLVSVCIYYCASCILNIKINKYHNIPIRNEFLSLRAAMCARVQSSNSLFSAEDLSANQRQVAPPGS
jgi:hypothetical protein